MHKSVTSRAPAAWALPAEALTDLNPVFRGEVPQLLDSGSVVLPGPDEQSVDPDPRESREHPGIQGSEIAPPGDSPGRDCDLQLRGPADSCLLAGTKKDEIDTALGCFENNAPRHALPLVSPVRPVRRLRRRPSCKTVIGQRLKQSGMHWTLPGADGITALRCREASSHWEAVCNTPDSQTRTA